MKTFTKIFALLFAFTIIGSMNLNAQHYPDPDGDGGAPLLELWVYGLSIDDAGTPITPAIGDEIAIYYGGTLVGAMELTVIPSVENWTSSHLIGYSKNNSGTALYAPEGAFLLEYWDVDGNAGAGKAYYAYTWGDGNDIDFHNTWWASTSESTSAMTTGAFFPPTNASSFCYVDLSFNETSWPLAADIHVTVLLQDGVTPVVGATVTAGGYNGVYSGAGGIYDIAVFAGAATDTDIYEYTVNVSDGGAHTPESFNIPVQGTNAGGTGFLHEVFLDAENDLSGIVSKKVLHSNGSVTTEIAENALVKTTIFGVVYEDYTDATGAYTLADVPDGIWDVVYSYVGYVTDTVTLTINKDGVITPINHEDVTLEILKGTIEGNIFDATTISMITGADDEITVAVYNEGAIVASTTTQNGSYSLQYYGGTYDSIYVSSANGGGDPDYFPYSNGEEYTFYPDYTQEISFNLLPTTYTTHFAANAITGDPNSLWSIHIEMAKFGSNFLLPYDEIAIYDVTADPEVLVGFLRLPEVGTYLNSGSNVLKAFATPTTGTGFVVGNSFEFRAYDISHDLEYAEPLNWFFNAGVGTYAGDVFPDPTTNPISYLNIYWDAVSGGLGGNVSDGAAVEGVLVELLNVFTQEVIDFTQTDASGDYIFNPLDAGTYYVRFTKAGYTTQLIKDVIVTQGELFDLDVVFAARASKWAEYTFTGIDWHFFGRCLEEIATNEDDMITLMDMNGAEVGVGFDGSAVFSTDNTTSWVKKYPSEVGFLEYSGGWTTPYDWTLNQGYQVYLNNAAGYEFKFEGYVVEPEVNPIVIESGISYIPYFPYDFDNPDDAIDAFASIFDKLLWVMDEDGNRLHHDGGGWIDNIGTLSPTAGYKIMMSEKDTLYYPAAKKKSVTNRILLDPVHFVYNGGNAADWTYTIHIDTDEFEIGDEIAAYSNGVMVGSMVIDSEDAWENDLNMFFNAIDGGYEINSPIELMAWDASNGDEYNVEFEMVAVNEGCYVGVNYPAGLAMFSYANIYRGTVAVDENQIDNNVKVYPNPTSGTLNIESVSNIKELHVYSIYGSLVSVVKVNSKQQSVDVSNYATGTYMVQLHTDTGVITKRVIIK